MGQYCTCRFPSDLAGLQWLFMFKIWWMLSHKVVDLSRLLHLLAHG